MFRVQGKWCRHPRGFPLPIPDPVARVRLGSGYQAMSGSEGYRGQSRRMNWRCPLSALCRSANWKTPHLASNRLDSRTLVLCGPGFHQTVECGLGSRVREDITPAAHHPRPEILDWQVFEHFDKAPLQRRMDACELG